MRSKVIFSFFVSFVVLGGILIWSSDRALTQQKMAWAESQSKAQISSLVLAIQGQLQAVVAESSTRPRREVLFSGMIEQTPQGEFQFAQSQTLSSSAGVAPKSWMSSYSLLAMKGVSSSPQKMKVGEMLVLTVLDPERKPYVLVLEKTSARQFVALLAEPALFQTMMDRQKGFSGDVFVLNSEAQTVAHSELDYVGTLLRDEPTAMAYLESDSRLGGGRFGHGSDEVLGFFEQVPRTNLAVLVSTRIESLTRDRWAHLFPLMAVLGGLLLIGLAVLYFLFKEEDHFEEISAAKPAVRPIQAISSLNTSPSAATPSAKMDLQNELKEAHRKVASALSHEMRSPLAAIMGNVQLAKSSLQSSPEVASSFLEKIENEARWMRDLVSKLSNYAGEKTNTASVEPLPVVLTRALTRVESKLNLKGIKLTKNIDDVISLSVPTDSFLKAIEAVLKNAIESMERAPRKELLVQLTQGETGIEISIADSGEGIAPENFGKLFDPFYTTKSSKENLGLGLSMAEGVFREHSGKISAKSEKGKGSEFVIHFPKLTKVTDSPADVPKAPATDLKPAPAELISNLPPAPEEFEPTVVLDPLLDSAKIEQILDGEDDDFEPTALLEPADLMKKDLVASPDVSEIISPAETVPTADLGFTSKIDPPKPKRKKSEDPFAHVPVNLRRPGAKL